MAAGPRDLAWHYTVGKHLPAILRSGVLLATALGSWGPQERPVVWFSRRRDWEPATCGGRRASQEEVDRFNAAWQRGGIRAAVEELRGASRIYLSDVGGIARIGVAPETAPHTWGDFARASGIPLQLATLRVEMDRAIGSDPADWRVSFAPVPSAKWLAVEWRPGTGEGERWERVGP